MLVHRAEAGLRVGVPLVGGLAIPDEGLRVVLRHAKAPFVHPTYAGLHVGIATLGQRTPEAHRRSVVTALKSSFAVLKRPRHSCAEQGEREEAANKENVGPLFPLKAAAAQKVATKLLKAGLAREIKAKTGMEAWRRDDETGQAYSLKLTDAGLKAIAADERGSQSIPSTAVPQNTNEDSSKAKTAANMAAAPSATAAPTATAPRQGTKIARVIELLQRDQGAKLEELIAATGWLPPE